MQHFLICLIVIEWYDRDSIVDLEGKTVYRVIDDNDVLEVSITKDPHIFHIIAFRCKEAMLSVEPMLNVLMIRVNIIEDSIRICLVACSEYNYLEVLVGLFETLHDVGSNVDACINSLFIWKINLKNDIRVLCFDVVNAMDKSLIHVEDNELFLYSRKIKLRFKILVYLHPFLGGGRSIIKCSISSGSTHLMLFFMNWRDYTVWTKCYL
jgi:hypothetical protein